MPFELGLTVMHASSYPGQHTWYVFESRARRIQKSLSDLGGTDAYIHDGSVKGVLREVGNALVRSEGPNMRQMMHLYRSVTNALPTILWNTGARSPFEARVFTELVYSARFTAKAELT